MRFIVDDSLPRLEYNTALQDHLNLSVYILSFVCIYSFALGQVYNLQLIPGFTKSKADLLDRVGAVTCIFLLAQSLAHLAWLRTMHRKLRPKGKDGGGATARLAKGDA